MKKSMQIRFTVMFCIFSAAFFMTNVVAAQTQKPKTFAEKAIRSIQKGIGFNIISSPCFAGGSSYGIKINQPEKYAFLWEVDGRNGGHQMSIDCACGKYATVRIMRLSDGYQVFKTFKLEKCNGSSF